MNPYSHNTILSGTAVGSVIMLPKSMIASEPRPQVLSRSRFFSKAVRFNLGEEGLGSRLKSMVATKLQHVLVP